MSERTALYRMFAADGTLLYIGIARDFGKRWTQHAASKPWWPDVQRQTVDWYPDRPAAEQAEREAIKAERPVHNIAGTPRRFKPTRPQAPLSSFDYLMGAAEIGRLLGVSRQRVQQLVSRPCFPEPCAVLAMGKIWLTVDVEDWAVEVERIPLAA